MYIKNKIKYNYVKQQKPSCESECSSGGVFPNLVECLKHVRDPRLASQHLGVMCVTARCFHS